MSENRVSEYELLEKRVMVLVTLLATNADKIRKNQLLNGKLDLRRLDATIRVANELRTVSGMLSELWENPECVEIVNN